MNGREAEEAEPILKALPNLQQYIFCSSAGVYLKSDEMPHREEDAVDPKSRHKVRSAQWAVGSGLCTMQCAWAVCNVLVPTPPTSRSTGQAGH